MQKIYAAVERGVYPEDLACPRLRVPAWSRPPTSQPEDTEHEYFMLSVKFFDVHQHRKKRLRVDLLGRFTFYHFSEYLRQIFECLMPRAVVCRAMGYQFRRSILHRGKAGL